MLLLVPQLLFGVPRIVNPNVKSATSFAIIIDKASYDEAAREVDAYRDVVEKDGLATYIVIDDWASPEEVRAQILALSKGKMPLEGVVFVGDIPIPMIRDAQYLSSAFKMDQNRDWKQSSIPSDRYYDDFDLKFNFIRQDEDRPLYFYYSIDKSSTHHIRSDIYSARIKPPVKEGVDKYELLRKYFRKVVAERQNENPLDDMFVFRGHGYNSEAMDAWAGEQLALKEQLPNVFLPGNTVRFYDFETIWPMKRYVMEKMQVETVDVALLHHHGGPTTQYLNGYRNTSSVRESIDNVKRYLRSKTVDRKDADERIGSFMQDLDVPRSWFDLSDSMKVVDSLYNVELDINVEDLFGVKLNSRFVMFDACYNGSFHQDEYIAGWYIFSDGKTIVTQGNTVNVIQDKWPDEFVGLFDHGIRIGQWHRHVQYLETHLIGDPTYRFANRADKKLDINHAVTVNGGNNKFWLKMLGHGSADVQAMALRKLADNGYPGIDRMLEDTYFSSPFGVVRMECLKLLSRDNTPEFVTVARAAAEDSYELVRRLAMDWIVDAGNDELIPVQVKSLTDDNLSKRASYYSRNGLNRFDPDKLSAEIKKQYSGKPYLYNGDELCGQYLTNVERGRSSLRRDMGVILDREATVKNRAREISYFRNYNIHYLVPELTAFAKDTSEDTSLRVAMIEALGWFDLSWRKAEIIDMCDWLIANDKDRSVVDEAVKTKSRLTRK